VILYDYEAPVAYSMAGLAHTFPMRSPQTLSKYACLWTAFNSIYVTLAARAGRVASLDRNPDGSPQTRLLGNLRIAKVTVVTEREQIENAYRSFPVQLKAALIEHSSTQFFARRTPRWRGRDIARDALGQRLNGVINIGYTTCVDYPVWAPIDLVGYERYVTGVRDEDVINSLAHQLLEILYTIRNNTLHGGKRADDANDIEVVSMATPLLEKVVSTFLDQR
jgi:hypothetical protein